MKTTFALALALLLCGCQEAREEAAEVKDEIKQETQELRDDVADATTKINPPEEPAKSFALDYPDVKNPDWEKEGEMYEASFKKDGHETAVIYEADGSLYATERDMAVSELPDDVRKAATVKGTISEAAVITMADGREQFEVEIGDRDYIYDRKGTLLAEKSGGEDDDD